MPLTHEGAVASLLDGPPLDTYSSEELAGEVAELLGSDDPLDVALVIEEAKARAADHVKAAAIIEAELEPCRLEQPCAGNEPLSGTGRCMTCGAQRVNMIVIDPIHEAIAALPSDTEAPEQPVAAPFVPAALEAAAPSEEPITARVKAALGLPDKDMAHLLGVARPTAQAYATGRLPEIIDGVRAEYMLRAVKKRLASLEALRSELQTIVNVSD